MKRLLLIFALFFGFRPHCRGVGPEPVLSGRQRQHQRHHQRSHRDFHRDLDRRHYDYHRGYRYRSDHYRPGYGYPLLPTWLRV